MNIKDFALIYKMDLKSGKEKETQEVIRIFDTFEEFEMFIVEAPKNYHSFQIAPVA